MKELKPYGDLTKLNKCRDLLDTIGKDTLDRVARSCIELLDTSAAIYEVDGSYATALFSSSYCKFMDQSSRDLCGTDDNEKALSSGKWICHETCWNKAATIAKEEEKSYDLSPCDGGVKLFATPIKAGHRVIGVISVGYGTPPTDEETVNELAEMYKVKPEDILGVAKEYQPRPTYIEEAAKRQIEMAAELLGELYLREKAEEEFHSLNKELEKKVEERTTEIKKRMEELQNFKDLSIGREVKMIELKKEINDLLQELGREAKYVIHEPE